MIIQVPDSLFRNFRHYGISDKIGWSKKAAFHLKNSKNSIYHDGKNVLAIYWFLLLIPHPLHLELLRHHREFQFRNFMQRHVMCVIDIS